MTIELDALEAEQVSEHQPGGSGADDADLGAHVSRPYIEWDAGTASSGFMSVVYYRFENVCALCERG